MKPAFELAQIIDRFGNGFVQQHTPNAYVQRTLRAIQQCRTAALGGHVDQCDTCGHIRISYNSCRNRHCPKCQNTQREAWIEDRKADLLPVPYFHVVFTVPDSLNALFLHRAQILYNILFRAAWETIAQFAFSSLNAETGMIAVLHTWGQNLSLHPHLHCIVPGGGVDHKNQWKQVRMSANGKVFLFPVKNMSMVFRGKFLCLLQKVLPQEKPFIAEMYKHNWVVYAKEPFAGPQQVVEYIGRYTHKVAISNHRLLSVDEKNISFRYLDYRDGKNKIMQLDGAEFLRRFCMHILPKNFVRIRHYGILSSTGRKRFSELRIAFGLLPVSKRIKKDWKQICREQLNYDPDICPHCQKGIMKTFDSWSPGRPPPASLSQIKTHHNSFQN